MFFLPAYAPIVLTSLSLAWTEMNPGPVGILDQLSHPDESGKDHIKINMHINTIKYSPNVYSAFKHNWGIIIVYSKLMTLENFRI